MQSTNFSIPVSIQMCNFSMNAALFRRLACRPAAFLAVWGGQTEREAPLADFKLHAARVRATSCSHRSERNILLNGQEDRTAHICHCISVFRRWEIRTGRAIPSRSLEQRPGLRRISHLSSRTSRASRHRSGCSRGTTGWSTLFSECLCPTLSPRPCRRYRKRGSSSMKTAAGS